MRVTVVSVVFFAVDEVSVDFGAEGFANLPCGAGEFHCGLAFGHAPNRKAVPLQPAANRSNFRILWPVQCAKLLGTEPLVIASAAWLVNLLQKLPQRSLSLRRTLQD